MTDYRREIERGISARGVNLDPSHDCRDEVIQLRRELKEAQAAERARRIAIYAGQVAVKGGRVDFSKAWEG